MCICIPLLHQCQALRTYQMHEQYEQKKIVQQMKNVKATNELEK